jgi:hypothetical protein
VLQLTHDNVDAEMETGNNNLIEPRQRKCDKRALNSLDAALDEENYGPFISANGTKEHTVVMEKAKRNIPAKELIWTNKKPGVQGRQRREDGKMS